MKKIPLSKNGTKYKGQYFAYVDNDVFPIVNEFDWAYHKTGYAYNSKMKILLHRYIWELKFGKIPDDKEVEHIDQNKLNCCLSNLRLATHSENMCNVRNRKDNTSGVKNISKKVNKGNRRKDGTYKEYTYWRAQISKDVGKKTEKTYAKLFDYTEEGFEQAKEWIKNMSLDIQGKFSIYNKPKKDK